MFKQLGIVDLLAAVKDQVETGTEYPCYDSRPSAVTGPYYYAEVSGKKPDHTDTLYRDVFTVPIHAVTGTEGTSEQVYRMIQQLEEAMSEDIALPNDFYLAMQSGTGAQAITTETTGEYQAVMDYEFTVGYGLRCK